MVDRDLKIASEFVHDRRIFSTAMKNSCQNDIIYVILLPDLWVGFLEV